MIFGQDRNELRKMYFDTWQKHRNKNVMSPLESLIADVISLHPEYHAMLESVDENSNKDFNVEDGQMNPFLHLGLHIAIREQVQASNPPIASETYQRLLANGQDQHSVEHAMLDCLAEIIWQSQKDNTVPDQNIYNEKLQQLT